MEPPIGLNGWTADGSSRRIPIPAAKSELSILPTSLTSVAKDANARLREIDPLGPQRARGSAHDRHDDEPWRSRPRRPRSNTPPAWRFWYRWSRTTAVRLMMRVTPSEARHRVDLRGRSRSQRLHGRSWQRRSVEEQMQSHINSRTDDLVAAGETRGLRSAEGSRSTVEEHRRLVKPGRPRIDTPPATAVAHEQNAFWRRTV